MTDEFYLQAAAIVCREVAVDHAYILYAERSEPVEEADSGWQFLCGRTTEDPEAAQVWALREVLAHDAIGQLTSWNAWESGVPARSQEQK